MYYEEEIIYMYYEEEIIYMYYKEDTIYTCIINPQFSSLSGVVLTLRFSTQSRQNRK